LRRKPSPTLWLLEGNHAVSQLEKPKMGINCVTWAKFHFAVTRF